MIRRAPFLPFLCLAAAACGESAPVGNGSAPENVAADTVVAEARPVRVGELGANFPACAAAGTTRQLAAGETLPVRSAPFDDAAETGAVPSGARFFVCGASLDQKWLGIVYDESGTLAQRCGVAEPVPARRDYDGPCRSGWTSSARVKLVAGDAPTPVAERNGAAPAAKGG